MTNAGTLQRRKVEGGREVMPNDECLMTNEGMAEERRARNRGQTTAFGLYSSLARRPQLLPPRRVNSMRNGKRGRKSGGEWRLAF
jgi:hypothetical protein